MLSLAKLWTWIGHLFIPFAIGWIIYVRNGFDDQPPAHGVLVSRAYWGLLISLAVSCTLTWTLYLYIRAAKQANTSTLVPPNTTFEDEKNRSRFISWGTVCCFALACLATVAVFGVRYSESQIHKWQEPQPIAKSFWKSRADAYALGCADPPCFAVAQRVEPPKKPIFGVNEYVLYLTDGALAVLVVTLLIGVAYFARLVLRQPAPARTQDYK